MAKHTKKRPAKFPGRRNKRRQGALERLKKQVPRDEAHAQLIKATIANLEKKLQAPLSPTT